MKYVLPLIFLASCGYEVVCDYSVRGVCVSNGEFESSEAAVANTIDVVDKELSRVYGRTEFLQSIKDHSLVIVFKRKMYVECTEGDVCTGSYLPWNQEIQIAANHSSSSRECAERHSSLLHELLHFVAEEVVQYSQEASENHAIPELFCTGECIEGAGLSKIVEYCEAS